MTVEDPSLVPGRPEAIGAILANRSFVPVFQPIVDIATGLVVGYEALSRFEDGRAPAAVFADARSVGLDLDLELATLRAALVAARRLPGGRWLDVNVSRRALDDPRLVSAISIADRRIALEISARELPCGETLARDIVRGFGEHATLAIVVEATARTFEADLEPGLIKLARDLTVLATTEADAGWLEALAPRRSSTHVVAEGVETAEEARILGRLGVELGQGHHFGPPALASVRPSAVN